MRRPVATPVLALLTLPLLLSVSVPVQADHDPVHTAQHLLEDAVGLVGPLPPAAVPLVGAVVIHGTGTVVDSVYTSPSLDCTVSDDAVLRSIRVECVPPASARQVQWVCLGPLLRVDVLGGTQGSITGYSGCADVLRQCTAYGPVHAPQPTSCMESGVAIQPLPMRCEADYANAAALEWQVACTNSDP